MSLLEKLRLGFLARARREKMLSVLFIVVLAVLWLVLLADRVKTFAPRLASVKATAEEQATWVSFEDTIATRYEEALATLRDRRLKGTEAYATVDRILRSTAGLQFRMDPPSSTRREQLTFYPININISKADYNQLRDLYQAIMRELPNVNLEEVTIAALDRSGVQLDAKFKFVAIEINE